MIKQVPNILTITRFLMIPIILYFALSNNYVAVILLLSLSGLTDILDGFIAKKYNCISKFGKLIDPLADKATQLSILVVLTIQEIISAWIVLIVALKEFVMVAGASFLFGKKLVVSSKWYGKLSTVLFYLAIVSSLFILYWNSKFDYKIYSFDKYIYYLAVISTIFSLIMYFKSFYLQGYLKNITKDDY